MFSFINPANANETITISADSIDAARNMFKSFFGCDPVEAGQKEAKAPVKETTADKAARIGSERAKTFTPTNTPQDILDRKAEERALRRYYRSFR